MNKKLISSILATSVFAAVASPVFAGTTITGEVIRQHYRGSDGKYHWRQYELNTSTGEQQLYDKWYDIDDPDLYNKLNDTAEEVMAPMGFKTDMMKFGDGTQQVYPSTSDGWTSTTSQDIRLIAGIDEEYATWQEEAETKWGYVNGMGIAQMKEWNGYLFVMTRHSEPYLNKDGLQVYLQNTYTTADKIYKADNPWYCVAYGVQDNGVWYATDAFGEYILDGSGAKQEWSVYAAAKLVEFNAANNRNETFKEPTKPTIALTKDVPVLRVYDLEGFDPVVDGSGKEYVQEWIMNTDGGEDSNGLDVNSGITDESKLINEWNVVGFDITDDYLYVFTGMQGTSGTNMFYNDYNKTMGIAVFENTIDRDTENIRDLSTLSRVNINQVKTGGKDTVYNNVYRIFNTSYTTVTTGKATAHHDRLETAVIGDKMLTFANNSGTVVNKTGTVNQDNQVAVTDISDIENGNITHTNYTWLDYLGYDVIGAPNIDELIAGGETKSDAEKQWRTYMKDVKLTQVEIIGNTLYALVGYKNNLAGTSKYNSSNKCWYWDILAYDISDIASPKLLSSTKHQSVSEALYDYVRAEIVVEGDYLYITDGNWSYNYIDGNTKMGDGEDTICIFKLNPDRGIDSLLQSIDLTEITMDNGYYEKGVQSIGSFNVMGDYLYIMYNPAVNVNQQNNLIIKLSADKTAVEETNHTAKTLYRTTWYGDNFEFGSRAFITYGTGGAFGQGSFQTDAKISVIDATDSGIVDMRVTPVPTHVDGGYRLEAEVHGISDNDGNVFKLKINDEEPIYVTYDEIAEGINGSIVDRTYSTRLSYPFNTQGTYTVKITPIDAYGTELTGAAETVKFTVDNNAGGIVVPDPDPEPEVVELKSTMEPAAIAKGTLTVSSKITNNAEKGAIVGTPIVALYDGNKLVDVKMGTEITVPEGEVDYPLDDLTLTVPQTADYSAYKVKAFFINMDKLQPLMKNTVLPQ